MDSIGDRENVVAAVTAPKRKHTAVSGEDGILGAQHRGALLVIIKSCWTTQEAILTHDTHVMQRSVCCNSDLTDSSCEA